MKQEQIPPLGLSLDMSAVSLVLEGLSLLPLGRALPLFNALKDAADKHVAEQQKPKRKRLPSQAATMNGERNA